MKNSVFFIFVFILIFSWIFSGWPPIFNFPPGIQEAWAALPGYRSSGTFTAGTGAITPPYPADMAANDICLLAVSSENQAITLTTANGFVEVPTWSPQGAGTAATDPASMLALYWKRTVGGDSAPVVADSINNTEGQIHCFSGVITSGDPWTTGAGGNDSAANDTTGVIPGATTATDDVLVALFISTSRNANSTTECSGWTNTDLANLTERTDNSSTQGLGGGHCMATGEKALQGTYGNTTVTMANTTYKGAISLALKPAPSTITVGTTGTQTSSMLIPSTNQYVGGAFTFVRNESTANVTSITISETDATLSAQSYLANLDLYYETAGTCTYDGTETLFGTDTAFDASEDAVITGTMAVGTSQVCVYAVLDVVSGAPNADTFDLEITGPSTEVVVSAGVVSPATAVAIAGATTINLAPAVKQDHYRWRNDNGYEATGGTIDVGNIRPDTSDVSNQMTITDGGCTSAYCVWDDNVTQPTAPGTASDYAQEGTDNELAEVNMGTIDLLGGTSPSITIWLYGTGAENVDLFSNDSTNGQTTCGSNLAVPDPGWVSATCTFVTAISQSALDGLTVTVRHNQVGGASTNTYYAVYAQVNKNTVGATWKAAEDISTGFTLDKSTNIRLRFQIDNTGGNASAYNYRLEWAAQSGTCDNSYSGESYAAVPDTATTEHFDMTTSAYFADGDPTTAQLSNAESYTFVAGDQVESTSNQSGAITLAQNQYTEVEYVFQANANATDGGVYCFRVTNAGTALNSADVIAQVTLAGGGAVVSVSISDGVISYGTIPTNSTKSTCTSELSDAQTVTNNGNVTESFTIRGQNSANWTLGAAAGSDQYAHKFLNGVCSTFSGGTVLTISNQSFATGVAVSGTATLNLQINTPNPSSVYTQQAVDVIITAVQQ